MDNAQARPLRNPSRTVAKVAVAVLVTIAIAGFVLAKLNQRQAQAIQATSAPVTDGAAASTTAASSAAAEDDSGADNEVTFPPSSYALSQKSSARLLRLAEAAKVGHKVVAVSASIEPTPDRAERMTLARQRAMAIRQVFESQGIPLAAVQIEIHGVPMGSVRPTDVNRLKIALR